MDTAPWHVYLSQGEGAAARPRILTSKRGLPMSREKKQSFMGGVTVMAISTVFVKICGAL